MVELSLYVTPLRVNLFVNHFAVKSTYLQESTHAVNEERRLDGSSPSRLLIGHNNEGSHWPKLRHPSFAIGSIRGRVESTAEHAEVYK